jgi:adenosylcobinamide kinase / adenosylcobinamide-phosphate guanylyltransferase
MADAAPAALPRVVLVLGGARSGKSAFAEALVGGASAAPVYVATARVCDAEMAARIEAHRARRGAAWTTVEEPVELVNVLLGLGDGGASILVDCLTLWVANLMSDGRDIGFEIERLVAALGRIKVRVVLVANEVGLGIVPENALARTFRDHAGRLNQRVATIADRVVFMAAGLPLELKGQG